MKSCCNAGWKLGLRLGTYCSVCPERPAVTAANASQASRESKPSKFVSLPFPSSYSFFLHSLPASEIQLGAPISSPVMSEAKPHATVLFQSHDWTELFRIFCIFFSRMFVRFQATEDTGILKRSTPKYITVTEFCITPGAVVRMHHTSDAEAEAQL